jgi:REP element-mobilizing transposase RayT
MHVTVRAARPLPSLRAERVLRLVKKVLRDQAERGYAGRFQIVHFSVQDTHVHLIIESHAGVIRTGISGFLIAFARRLNALLRRTGRVWEGRYHRTDLATPTQTRNVLRYVFCNFKHHMRVRGAGLVDTFSSAARFGGWSAPIRVVPLRNDTEPWPQRTPRTWLLDCGWRRGGGLLHPAEAPART